MSEHTAAVAVDAMLITNPDDNDFGWEMLALMEAVDFDYERWCRVMGLDPDLDASFEHFSDIHARWAGTFWEMGEKPFIDAIKEKSDKWRGLLERKVVF